MTPRGNVRTVHGLVGKQNNRRIKMKAQFSTVPRSLGKLIGMIKRKEKLLNWPEESIRDLIGWEPILKNAVNFEIPYPDIEKERESGWRELIIDQKIKGLFLPFENISVICKNNDGEYTVVLAKKLHTNNVPIFVDNRVITEEYVIVFRWFNSVDGEWLPLPFTIGIPNSIQDGERTTFLYTAPFGNTWVMNDPKIKGYFDYNSRMALRILLNLCAFLDVGREYVTTNNHKEKLITASKSNGRKKKDKFYEIHRLTLNPVVISGRPEHKGGTHASPRWHKRRGYWRVMKKSGKQVWVRDCEVGSKSNGMVYKDYQVTTGE